MTKRLYSERETNLGLDLSLALRYYFIFSFTLKVIFFIISLIVYALHFKTLLNLFLVPIFGRMGLSNWT